MKKTKKLVSVLLLVALGGCFSERSGIINLGLEGIMVAGALGGALVMKYMPGLSAPMMVICVVLGSVIFGMIFSLLLAVAAINFNADQTLVGTAMNMLATAAATVFVKALNMAENPNNVASTIQYINQKKAFSIVKIAGFGFLALAVMIFGQWKPNLIALAALLFGLFRALSNVYSGFDFLASLNISGIFYKMLPYIISLLVLAVSSKRSRAPKAEGIPYDKGQR